MRKGGGQKAGEHFKEGVAEVLGLEEVLFVNSVFYGFSCFGEGHKAIATGASGQAMDDDAQF